MIIFVDESGVHKQKGKSSVVLVYVMVENVEKLEKSIIETEGELKITSFHWAKHIWKIRQAFIQTLQNEDFTVKAAIIQNPFSNKQFEDAIEALLTERKINKMVIDGKKPKWYLLRLKKILRGRGISVKKIRVGNDKSFPCLRLADAYAGLIRAYWEDKENKKVKKVYKIANKKITTQVLSGQAIG